jgi:hypothetical protein
MDGQPPQFGAIPIDLATEDGMMEDEQRPGSEVAFDTLVVRKMLESAFSEADTQVEQKAVQMSAEVMRMFVGEAVHRAGALAQEDARHAAGGAALQGGEDADAEAAAAPLPSVEIQAEHFVKILPQLLLDFS